MMALREAARLLGGNVQAGKISCPGPDHSKADRSLTVWLSDTSPEGFACHSFAGDDIRCCRDHVRTRLNLPERQQPAPQRRQPTPVKQGDDERSRIDWALDIWRNAVPISGTPASRYLQSRGLALPASVEHVLRFHPRLRYEGQFTPALVALFRNITTNQPSGIHRVFLNANGTKLDRRMLGQVKNAAIKLDPNENVSLGLHVVEGIETGLAAQQVGYCPVWALGSVGAVAEFPVLAGIEGVVIMDENDAASAWAAFACAKRYRAAGRGAHICRPPKGDLNDALMPGPGA